MKALKWVGYILLAVAVLAVGTGLGLVITAIVTVGGLVVAAIGAVCYAAVLLRGLITNSDK